MFEDMGDLRNFFKFKLVQSPKSSCDLVDFLFFDTPKFIRVSLLSTTT